MNHNEVFDVLVEMLDAEIASTEGKRDNLYLSNWLRKSYEDRISLLRAVRSRLRDSLLVNQGHFSLTVSPEKPFGFTQITAQVARLKQEVRVCEQERLMSRNEHYLEDTAKELRDKFKQSLFEPPQVEEQTPPEIL